MKNNIDNQSFALEFIAGNDQYLYYESSVDLTDSKIIFSLIDYKDGNIILEKNSIENNNECHAREICNKEPRSKFIFSIKAFINKILQPLKLNKNLKPINEVVVKLSCNDTSVLSGSYIGQLNITDNYGRTWFPTRILIRVYEKISCNANGYNEIAT